MSVGGDGFANCKSLQCDAPEGLRIRGAGDNDVGDGHHFAQVAAVADKCDVVFYAGHADCAFDFLQKFQLLRVGFANNKTVDGYFSLFEAGDDFDEI